MRFINFILFICFIAYSTVSLAQDTLDYKILSKRIINSDNSQEKLILSNLLTKKLYHILIDTPEINSIDSTGLLKELISKDDRVQLISWAISFNDQWEYFAYLKTYNEIKGKYQVFDLVSTDFIESINTPGNYNQDNWPAGVYFKMIENEYNKRKYYTLLGWLSPNDQTSYKFIEVMTLSKSGKPYFGKTNYFKKSKVYNKRLLFSYNRQSKFLLDYGEYEYSTRKWNRKKNKYDIKEYSEDLIVFDHLISKYPEVKEIPEFLVPAGNLIDAFKFEKGKWVFISDIDARNMKRKERKKNNPQMNLFEEPGKLESN